MYGREINLLTSAIARMNMFLNGIEEFSIETVWHGVVTPPTNSSMQCWRYENNARKLNIGEEMGRFNMGSKITVLFGKDKEQWVDGFQADKRVKLGELIGRTVG